MSRLRSSKLNIFSQTAGTAVFSLLSAVVFLVTLGVLTRLYTVEAIGVFFFATAMAYIASQIPSGFGLAVQKRVSEENGRYLSYYALLMGFLGAYAIVLLCLAGILSATVLPVAVGDLVVNRSVVFAIAVGTVAKGTGIALGKYLGGLGKFVFTGGLMFGAKILGLIGVIGLSYSGWLPPTEWVFVGLESLVVGLVFITPLVGARLSEQRQVWPTHEQARSVGRFAIWSIPSDILGDFYHRIDTVLLAYFVGSAAVGFYESSVRIMGLTFAVPGTIKGVLQVKVSGYNEEGIAYRPLVKQVLAATTSMMLLFSVVALVFGERILMFVYGPAYAAAYPLFAGLAVFIVLQNARIIYEAVLFGTDQPRAVTIISTVAILVNLVTAPYLILTFGAVGMVYSTIGAEAMRVVSFYILYRSDAQQRGEYR